MALLDLPPKESTGELFGRDAEVQELTRLIEARRWAVVLGGRMIGKTSLVKAVQARLRRPGAYVNLWGIRSIHGLLEGLVQGLNASRSLRSRLLGAAARVDGLTLGPVGLSLSGKRPPLATVSALLDLLGRETKECLIVLDEVQELAPNSGQLLKLLGRIFNTRTNVVFVFTGSVYGLTKVLLEPSARSPLYGRAPVALRLSPFSRERAAEFLRLGTREFGLQLSPEEIGMAVDGPLDGTPGWLTLYGNHLVVRKLSPARALAETIREGKRVAADELRHFFGGRVRSLYWPALKATAVGSGFAAVRAEMAREAGGPVNNGTVARVLHGLEAALLVEQEEGVYRIVDPMVRTYVMTAKEVPS
jgi:uncharacterized protein